MNKKWSSMIVLSVLVIFAFCCFVTPSEAAKKMRIRMAGQSSVEHQATHHQKEFAEKINEATDGRIEIRVYPANQLGDYTQVYEEIVKGSIEMALISVPSQFDQRLELTYFPYLLENYEQVKKAYVPGGFLFEILNDLHDNLGVKLLGFNVEGFGGFGTTKPVEAPADPDVEKTVLIRVPPMDVFKLSTEAMGFPTVSIPYAETYTALQTGVCEGWTGGPPVLTWLNYRDVIEYYYQYNCYLETESWLINNELWESLSEEDKKLFMETAQELQLKSIGVSQKEDMQYLKKLEEFGMEVTTFTDEEIAQMANKVREVAWPKLEKRVSPEIMEKLEAQYN